ncbi:hypothetical protein B0H14DRAFT_3124954 [Mycena olivaceomarginata]|nr:hypothetical protein B0H14DRAFT_3124954 [Mycena olivaceomarginata]
MSDHSLPDEIISEILSPALKVSDEIFSDTSEVSPFAKYSESTSAYLASRLDTPPVQHRHPPVQGSGESAQFGADSGLCKGLPLLNPTRLILWDLSFVGCVSKINLQVDRLTIFDCPFARTTDWAQKVISPLIKPKRLHALAIPRVSASLWVYDTCKECPLEVIHIKDPLEQYERTHYLPRFKNEPKLMALLKFTERTTRVSDELEPRQPESALELPLIAPSFNPSFTPLAGAPEDIHDKVWARVLHFAMSVPELANGCQIERRPSQAPAVVGVENISRTNSDSLSYYAHVVLRRSAALTKFAAVLSSDPSIGPHVRSLVAEYWDYMDQSWDSEDESSTDELGFDFRNDVDLRSDTMLAVLSRTTGLTAFRVANVPANGIARLRRATDNVHKLIVHGCIIWDESLRCLVLSIDDSTNPGLETLLKAHGPKLTDLNLSEYNLNTLGAKIFELCPNLHSLFILGHNAPDISHFKPPSTFTSLVKIILDVPDYWRSRNLSKDEVVKWG